VPPNGKFSVPPPFPILSPTWHRSIGSSRPIRGFAPLSMSRLDSISGGSAELILFTRLSLEKSPLIVD
jgi:hypothetical protein